MQRCRRRLILPWLFFLFPFVLGAQQYLFVFHAGSEATVYNLTTLEPLASPLVATGAIRAIGVPDQVTPSNFSKIYIVCSDSVVVLDPQPPFAVRAALELRAPVSLGQRSALLTQDSKRLLVADGRFVHVFDATDPTNPQPAAIDLGKEVTGLTALTNSERAYATVLDSDRVEIISLNSNPPIRLAGPIPLPQVPTAIGAAPNASALYAAATGSLFEINPVDNTLTREIEGTSGSPLAVGFDPDAPVATAFVRHGAKVTAFDLLRRTKSVEFSGTSPLTEAVSPGSDLIYFFSAASGQIYLGKLSNGDFGQLLNPATQAPFDRPGVDIELDPSNRDLFLALGTGSGRIVRLNAEATILRNQIVPLEPPTGLSAIASPGAVAAAIEVYGGNHQLASVGKVLPKPLVVRAIDSSFRPAANQSVQFSTATPNVVFRPPNPLTNHAGIAQTMVTAPITDPFTIEARILPVDLGVTFDVNTALPEEEGLSIVSGDYQMTAGGTDFPRPFRVRAVTSGGPIPNLSLSIATTNFAGNCPAMAMTGADGEASFSCSAAAVAGPVATLIQVTDSFGRTLPEPFHVTTVVNPDKLPRDGRLISPAPLVGEVNTTVNEAIAIRATERIAGLPVPNLGIEFSAPGDVSVNPPIAVTNAQGIARANVTFGCTIETNQITATLNSTGLPMVVIPHSSVRGPVTRLLRLQGNNQSGNAGDALPLALLTRATDECGNVAAGAPLTWEVVPPEAASLENAFGQTNANGEASARVRIGTRPGPFAVRVSSGAATVDFNLTAVATANRVVAISGDNQSVPAGQAAPQPLVVELQDAGGNPIANTQVNFRITQGSGGLGGASAVTDESGRASTMVTAGPQVGPLLVEARSGDGVFVFTLTVIGRTPVVTAAGFVNGASFVSGWTPGSTGSIFGVGLMEDVDGVVVAPAPFPTTLRGVRVLVENTPAPILSLANVNGQEQINIQVPFGIPAPGQVLVTIINNGASAAFSGVTTFTSAPGVFEVSLPGGRFAAALHADFSLVEPDNPARPGEVLLLFWTGGGGTNPLVATNQPGPIPPAETTAAVTVIADGSNAEVLGSFYAPTLVTVYQTNFRVPAGASGANLVVQLIVNGAQSQQVMIPLAQ
jgi:uncharacterized protein (TIGR03437 family)